MSRLTLLTLLVLSACDEAPTPPPPSNGLVSSIELQPAVALVQVGKTVQLVPVALDAQQHVLGGVQFTFASTDPSVATVDQGLVTALKEGVALVTASANGKTSSPTAISVNTTAPTKTSDQVIATLLATGSIDDETALLYRVYAVFKDPRLPLGLQGDDSEVQDSDALDQARARWPTLKPETRDALESFFVPPAYLGSWVSRDRKPRALINICKAALFDPNWKSIPATGGRFKVWFDDRVPGSLAQATGVLAELEGSIYPRITGEMGMKPPVVDGPFAGCNGGDDRIDVYLVDMATHGQDAVNLGETSPVIFAAENAPVNIRLNRNLITWKLHGAAAHEFMHACQWAYDVNAPTLDAYKWLKEATAQEAIDQALPLNDTEQSPVKLRAYLDEPFEPLDLMGEQRIYGSYLFFQFLARARTPALIGAIWAQTLSKSAPLEAVDAAIPGGLKAQWPLFAQTLWNAPPVSTRAASFAKWDTMFEKPYFDAAAVGVGANGEAEYPLVGDLKSTSVTLAHLTFPEVSSRALMFHNTFYPLTKAGQAVSVQALWHVENGAWQEEDWTEMEWIGFCRDQKDQRIDELIIVLGNAERQGTVTAATAPSLKVSNMPCWGLTGTASRVTHESTWSAGQTSISVTANYGSMPVIESYDPTQGRLRVQIAYPMFADGSGALSDDYTSGATCRHVANANLTLSSVVTGGDVGSNWTMNIFPEALPPDLLAGQQALVGSRPRAYLGDGSSSRMVSGLVTGPAACPTTYVATPSAFLLTQTSVANAKAANDDGSFSGTAVDGSSTYTWQFTPRREP